MRSLLITVAAAALGAAHGATTRYNTAKKIVPGAINVHLVPHSHDDVGWLKTVDQYSVGANNSIQHANTGLTIDTVLSMLVENPDRHFIYVEQAFFQRWMESASESQQAQMREVVASGQMEFINGGWCMHDESSPSYVDMLDQTALGHRLIKEQFGVVPRATWQIDPFGHSATQASLLSSPLAGYTSLFFGRIDYQDRAFRVNATALEMIWRASPANLGPSAQTFADVMPGYGPPGGLCWDEAGCTNTQPIQDDPLLQDYNVDFFVNLTVTTAYSWKPNYRADSDGTLHIMWPMGSDFQYTNARGWYKNLDKLVHYTNLNTSGHGVNVLYSTPSLYADAKLAQTTSWPLKTDDFFPYADGPHAMWTGYFTSRAALKGYVRDTSAVHQAARQLQFLAAPPADTGAANALYRLERAIGVTQHHDSVSGTSKQHVAYDYAMRLAWGRADAAAANAAALGALLGAPGLPFATCDLANATICPPLEAPVVGTPVLVTVYNQQAQAAAAAPVRIPVGVPAGVASYAVTGPSGAAVPAQLIPATPADAALRTGYYGAPAVPMAWLVWQAPLPAVGYAAFVVAPSATSVSSTHVSAPARMRTGGGLRGGDQTLTNGVLTLTVSAATGMVSQYANAATGVTRALVNSWGWYNSSVGGPNDNTTDFGQKSGAYIFRPNTSTLFPASAAPATVSIVTGPIVSEAQITVAPGWISQVVRLWAGASFADFEWTVGPIPYTPGSTDGKEVVARYATDLVTAGAWATDSNCREMQARKRDYRPGWNYTVIEPVAGNYYPVNCRITAADAAAQQVLSVTTDRTQGGASMVDGSVELMVHRRLGADDSRGVGEPLNETGLDATGTGLIVRGMHRLSIDTRAAAPGAGKGALQDLMFAARTTASALPPGTAPAAWLAAHNSSFSGLAAPLPASVHLLTAHAQSRTTVLVRLAHLFEAGEDAVLSQPATVGLAGLFARRTLSGCEELTLPASLPLSAVPVRTVIIDGQGASTYPTLPLPPAGPALEVTIAPMAVRTFSCTYA